MLERISNVERQLGIHEATCLEQSKANGTTLKALQDGHAAILGRLDGLNATAWRMVAAVTFPIISLLIWFFVQVWPVHNAGQTYTAADAARDRAEIETRAAARDQALLAALQRTNRP